VAVESYPVRIDAENTRALVASVDVVVDCSDTFDTRYVVNDACCAERVPLVEAGVLAFSALVLSVRPGQSACYRCAFPTPPAPDTVPSCREAGVLGATAGVVGAIQALEAIKLLSGVGQPLTDRILQLDAATMEQLIVTTSRQGDCPACGGLAPAPQST
jgi:molybdopterin-synthase adenylyltransferase